MERWYISSQQADMMPLLFVQIAMEYTFHTSNISINQQIGNEQVLFFFI